LDSRLAAFEFDSKTLLRSFDEFIWLNLLIGVDWPAAKDTGVVSLFVLTKLDMFLPNGFLVN